MQRETRDIVIWPTAEPIEAGLRCGLDILDPAVQEQYAETLPQCPTCGERITKGHQIIHRSGEILRVDGLAHVELKSFEEHSYKATSLLECQCGIFFRPQQGVDIYTQAEAVKLYDVPEKVENDQTSFDASLFW